MMIDRHMEISRNIIKFYDTNVQTNDLFTKKMQLRQAIYSIIKGEEIVDATVKSRVSRKLSIL